MFGAVWRKYAPWLYTRLISDCWADASTGIKRLRPLPSAAAALSVQPKVLLVHHRK